MHYPTAGHLLSKCPSDGARGANQSDDRGFVDEPIDQVLTELLAQGVELEEGPVERTGATGPIISVYLRDPDQNLIELSNYL